MPTATVEWVSGRQFVGTDSRGRSVLMSGSEDQDGASPSEMLMLSLAGCTSYDVIAIMEKKRQPLSSFHVTVTGERASDPPWAYQTIHLQFRVSGEKVVEKALADAIALSQEKYCSVAATIRGVAQITTGFEILP